MDEMGNRRGFPQEEENATKPPTRPSSSRARAITPTLIHTTAVSGIPVNALIHKLCVNRSAPENKLSLAEIMQLGAQWE
jgi:hypothetical protein